MSMNDEARARFDADEEREIRGVAERGGVPDCPRCAAPMSTRPIGGGSFGLGYARRREWLICGECRRSVIFDRKRGTRT
jgi:hypothetical protein